MDDLHAALALIKSLLQKGLLVKKHSSHQVKDPFAQIVFDHMDKEKDKEETFTKITSFFKRDSDQKEQQNSESGNHIRYKNDQYDSAPQPLKAPYKVILSKKELELIKKALNG